MAGSTTESKRESSLKMRIPIIAPLEKHISTLESVDEYVHPTLSEKYNRMRYLSYEFGRHLHILGIVTRPESIRGQRKRCVCPKTFHSLRATATTFLHAAGVDHALAREIVGHDSETSHQLYIRPSAINARRRWRSFPR